VGREGGCWRRSFGDSCRILGDPCEYHRHPLEPLPGRVHTGVSAPWPRELFLRTWTWKENTF
jgi:hypothetical protein